jgi:hypothetical protein
LVDRTGIEEGNMFNHLKKKKKNVKMGGKDAAIRRKGGGQHYTLIHHVSGEGEGNKNVTRGKGD